MTISEILAEVDELKPNTYDDAMKIRWLSDLDGQIFRNVILTHEHDDDLTFEGYTESDLDTDLLVEFPHTDIYRHYLFAMIDYSNGETDRYQDSMTMFNWSYRDYTNDYNRNTTPITVSLKF